MMVKKTATRNVLSVVLCVAVFLCLSGQLSHVRPLAAASGATASLHVVKYDSDANTILAGRTIDYQWMEKNLPVQGDGVTHYYHQGPVFDGDPWDPGESVNLKDKGAVRGTDVKDLCDLVGGMSPDDEVILRAVDGWSTRLAYSNIYEPSDRQGPVVLCWFKGTDGGDGQGSSYPGNDGYNEAIQVVFMAQTKNGEGKYVFGNSDMQACLPEEKYQHFYEGLPSTNGLSGKWIDAVVVCPAGSTPDVADGDTHAATEASRRIPWLPIGLGAAGLLMVAVGVCLIIRKRGQSGAPTGGS